MTIEFGRIILRPSPAREPAYDSQEACAAGYTFPCAECETPVTLDLPGLLERAGDERMLGGTEADRIREHFEFNLVGKAHDGGGPRIAVERCRRCGTRHLVYLGVREPANGWYRVTVQGITELKEEPPAV